MFDYTVYPRNSRFLLVYSGDYTHDRDAAHDGLHKAAAQAKASTPYFDMVVDMSDFFVAPKDRAGSGGEMLEWCLANGLRRAAFVTHSAIFKMQLKRLSQNSEKLEYFDSRMDAEDWLDRKMRGAI
ncbi:MAG: hypothetical protein AAGL10_14490 [Pseudomonadota bacterium]